MELMANEARQLACESALNTIKGCVEDAAGKGLQRYTQWHNMGDDAARYVKNEMECAGYKVILSESAGSYYWNISW